MTFDNKKEADAYNKELEISEDMSVLLEKADVAIDEKQMEELCLFLAKNKEQAMAVLKGSKPKLDASSKPVKEKAASGAKKAEDNKSAADSVVNTPAEPNKSKNKAA